MSDGAEDVKAKESVPKGEDEASIPAPGQRGTKSNGAKWGNVGCAPGDRDGCSANAAALTRSVGE